MYAVAKAILADPSDPTQMALMLCNQTDDDILMRTEMDALEAAHPTRFKVHYIIEKCADEEAWAKHPRQSLGRIGLETMQSFLPPAAEDTLAFMCGPPPMLNYGCIPNLKAMGFSEQNYFSF